MQRNKCEMKRARLCTDLALILCKKCCRTNYLVRQPLFKNLCGGQKNLTPLG